MTQKKRMVLFSALVWGLLAALPASASDTDPNAPGSLLEAARLLSSSALRGEEGGAGVDIRWSGAFDGGFRGFWRAHRYHILTVFLADQAEYQYAQRVGVSNSPLLFDTAPGVDQSVRDSLYEGRGADAFVEKNKTNVLRAVAIGSILGSNRLTWSEAADDFMGLIEAEKFNTATNGLVKMVVGRRRPALDTADPDEVGQAEYDRIQARRGGRLSFYSAATSEAFTYCSYLDLIVARRLEGYRGARIATGVGLYALAGYIGYTRLEQGEHYLSDVLAGAAAGITIGRRFYHVNHKAPESEEREPRFRLNPPAPMPGGGMVSFSVDLGRR
ncbi:MAG TPA: phosphatase PAP2 family protein [Candidatus Polarisedimenticolia bacterium]